MRDNTLFESARQIGFSYVGGTEDSSEDDDGCGSDIVGNADQKAQLRLQARPSSQASTTWGRAWTVDFPDFIGCLFILVVCPFIPTCFYLVMHMFSGSLQHAWSSIEEAPLDIWIEIYNVLPSFSPICIVVYVGWMLFQVQLSTLPDVCSGMIPGYVGGLQDGAVTPAGIVPIYNVNGLQAWIITHFLWAANALVFHLFAPSYILRHFGSFLIITNVCGYALSTFSYIKGKYFPSHADDCKFSGSVLYDYLMGVELNPRLGKYFDFKLFFNGRPGIIAWTLINWSCAAYQHEAFGYVSDSMLLVNLLQCIYVVDFFWNERWYLKTLDICHDHFGFYLAWGDLVWLPFTYTLQAVYLARYPVDLGAFRSTFILVIGVAGYVTFRSANYQKDAFRRGPKNCRLWGKHATYIECSYVSSDGRRHDSALLTSGWWGIARHMNYTGDLIGSLSYCLCCGTECFLPYFYFVYMLILLVHRIYRDEHRCKIKYGRQWEEYTSLVPYRLIPGVF